MDKILIATKNPGKLAEFKVLLKDVPIKLLSLNDLKIIEEAPEDGRTFRENAAMKAKFYQRLSGFSTIADDGGLEIDALGGEPGVRSRRWFGYKMSDQELIDQVLEKMNDVPLEKRTARMRTAIALVLPGKKEPKIFEGKIEVIIAPKPAKKIITGYPFRSFMYLPQQKKYFVDIPFSKQSIFSHRGEAVKKLKPYLNKLLKPRPQRLRNLRLAMAGGEKKC